MNASRTVPTCYKDAYVFPRLKRPRGDLSSYRPSSNLPFLFKLLERVVRVLLTGYLSSAGLLPVPQSACRRFHLTETALLKVVTDLRRATDAKDHALLGCLICLISLLSTTTFWSSAWRGLIVFVWLRLTGSVLTFSIADNRCSITECHHRLALSCAVSHRARCWGLCYSCLARPTLLLVSAYHLISTPLTRNSIRGDIAYFI